MALGGSQATGFASAGSDIDLYVYLRDELPVAQRAALLLVGVTAMLGEPFNYESLWGGRLVQNMIPVRGKEYQQTSQSSRGTLDWHVEDGFREDRCDYAGLICLRGDPAAVSSTWVVMVLIRSASPNAGA